MRNSDGTLKLLIPFEAEAYCRSIGKRIPTIKEFTLAFHPEAFSAKAESRYDHLIEPEGEESFYFNLYRKHRYIQPVSEDRNLSFYSSSIRCSRCGDYGTSTYYYNFSVKNGEIGVGINKIIPVPFRCVSQL